MVQTPLCRGSARPARGGHSHGGISSTPPSTVLDAVHIQDRDEFAGKMNLAQRFLFSCVELPAIWLGALQSLPPLSPSGEAMFFSLCVLRFPECMAHAFKIFASFSSS